MTRSRHGYRGARIERTLKRQTKATRVLTDAELLADAAREAERWLNTRP